MGVGVWGGGHGVSSHSCPGHAEGTYYTIRSTYYIGATFPSEPTGFTAGEFIPV